MAVQGVYWRRKAVHDQRGIALKAAVAAQTQRLATSDNPTAIPVPVRTPPSGRAQPVAVDELVAFRRALQSPALPAHRLDTEADVPPPESHSDFSALSETQYGKL
ncbi:hypothetical protein D9M69_666700 [compost metagenome]